MHCGSCTLNGLLLYMFIAKCLIFHALEKETEEIPRYRPEISSPTAGSISSLKGHNTVSLRRNTRRLQGMQHRRAGRGDGEHAKVILQRGFLCLDRCGGDAIFESVHLISSFIGGTHGRFDATIR